MATNNVNDGMWIAFGAARNELLHAETGLTRARTNYNEIVTLLKGAGVDQQTIAAGGPTGLLPGQPPMRPSGGGGSHRKKTKTAAAR